MMRFKEFRQMQLEKKLLRSGSVEVLSERAGQNVDNPAKDIETSSGIIPLVKYENKTDTI